MRNHLRKFLVRYRDGKLSWHSQKDKYTKETHGVDWWKLALSEPSFSFGVYSPMCSNSKPLLPTVFINAHWSGLEFGWLSLHASVHFGWYGRAPGRRFEQWLRSL